LKTYLKTKTEKTNQHGVQNQISNTPS